jgi:hypothetical protein
MVSFKKAKARKTLILRAFSFLGRINSYYRPEIIDTTQSGAQTRAGANEGFSL